MITRTCCKCQKSFPLGEARLDEHWSGWSPKPAYAYCPHCDERLDGVHFNSVHVARALTWHNLSLAAIGFVLSALALATDTLSYVGPAMIAVFGLWLARTSKLRDHRIVGWLLMLVSGGALYGFNFAFG